MASLTTSGSSSAVRAPGFTERCTKRSPLAALVRSSAVHSTPAWAAKPSRARVGLPSVSSAMFTSGPSTSECCSGCSTATPGSRTARRRGVYSGRAPVVSTATPRFCSAATTPSKKACARPGSALTGSSSVPSSISRGSCLLMDVPVVDAAAGKGARSRAGLQSREAELLALGVVGLGHGLGQGAHAQDVALALGYRDGAARVQQVERMRGLAHLLVGRQGQAGLDQLQRLALAGVEAMEQFGHVGVLEVVRALLDFVLVVHVAV